VTWNERVNDVVAGPASLTVTVIVATPKGYGTAVKRRLPVALGLV
jgi:hypothetical protein